MSESQSEGRASQGKQDSSRREQRKEDLVAWGCSFLIFVVAAGLVIVSSLPEEVCAMEVHEATTMLAGTVMLLLVRIRFLEMKLDRIVKRERDREMDGQGGRE